MKSCNSGESHDVNTKIADFWENPHGLLLEKISALLSEMTKKYEKF